MGGDDLLSGQVANVSPKRPNGLWMKVGLGLLKGEHRLTSGLIQLGQQMTYEWELLI